MSWRRTPAWTYGALIAASCVALRLGAQWNDRLVVRLSHGQVTAGQPVGQPPAPASGVYQRIVKTPEQRSAEYGFVNFNADRLNISYAIPESEFRRYNGEYGYHPEDIDALKQWRDDAIRGSYLLAVKLGKNQAQVNAAAAAIQKQYEDKVADYLASRGFVETGPGVTRISIPAVVRRNKSLLKPIAQSFESIASSRRYGSMDVIGAVLSFVQTALKYRQPQDVFKGKHTGGILPPVTTLVLGWGDCDTKTGLMASILSNWASMRMVGVSVPGHYLMAVLQIPDKGDQFVEYDGLKYILLEPAGPGWLPPGQVAEETIAQLNGSDGYRIEPFF